jgi:hypothetical protein
MEAGSALNALRRYRLRPPTGAAFEAAIVYADSGLRVLTNRQGGVWRSDPAIQVADLLMPEQNLNEWDVERLPVGEG